MRPPCVVQRNPSFGDVPDLIQRREQVSVQDFVPVSLVEAFNERILVRFAGLDVAQLDLVVGTPVDQCL